MVRPSPRSCPPARPEDALLVAGFSAEQVRTAETPLLARGEPLMRRAAAGLAAAIRNELENAGRPRGPVLVLVGTGDNGGDALFAAADLAESAVEVEVAPVSTRRHAVGEEAARRSGVAWIGDDGQDPVSIAAAAGRAAVVVDGILGTGTSASPAMRGAAREIVAAVQAVLGPSDARTDARARPLVIAVDLPSGTHPDDGSVPDPTVLRADLTVTFGAVKAGVLLEPAADYAGRLEVVDLGLAPFLADVTPLVERA